MRLRLVVPFLLLSFPASAIDFTQPILDEDGKPSCMVVPGKDKDNKDFECPADKVATLGRIARQALNFSFPDEKIEGDEKYKRWEIAQGLVGSSDAKPKSEDRALIKKLIGKLYPPSVVFPAWNMLEK